MSFPIIGKMGGQEKAIGILAEAGHPIKPHAIRMWRDRGVPAHAQLAFMKKAVELGIDYDPSDFIYQKEPANG